MLTDIELVAAEVAAGVSGLHDHGFAGDGGGGEGEPAWWSAWFPWA